MPPGLRQNLQIIISAKDQVTAPVKKINGNITSFGQGLKSVAKVGAAAFAAIAAAMVALGAQAVRTFSGFETAMRNVWTLLPIGEEAFQSLSDSVVEMSKSLPQSAEELGASLYDIVSAGVTDTAEAMKVLEISAKAGTAGLTDAKNASKGAISIMNAFGQSAGAIPEIFDKMFATVRVGITTFPEISEGVGRMASQFAAAGATITEMMGSLAFLTRVGLNTNQSVTRLARAMAQLVKQKDKLRDFGAPVFDAQGQFRGLESIVGDLRKQLAGMTTEEQLAKLQELVPQQRAAQALQAMINNYDKFRESVDAVRDATGATEDAFAKQADSMANKIKVLRNVWNAFLINLGGAISTKLVPVIEDITEKLKKFSDDSAESVENVWLTLLKSVIWVAKQAGLVLTAIFDKTAEGARDLAKATADTEKELGLVTLQGTALAKANEMLNKSFQALDAAKLRKDFERLKGALPTEDMERWEVRIRLVESTIQNMKTGATAAFKDLATEIKRSMREAPSHGMLQILNDQFEEFRRVHGEGATGKQLVTLINLLAEYRQTLSDSASAAAKAAQGTRALFESMDELSVATKMTSKEMADALVEMNKDLDDAAMTQTEILEKLRDDRIKLVNEAVAANVLSEELGKELTLKIWEDFNKSLGDLNKKRANELVQLWTQTIDRIASGIGDAVAGLIVANEDFAESMRNMINSIKRVLISTLIEIAIKKLIARALSGDVAAILLIVGGAIAALNALRNETAAGGGGQTVPSRQMGGPVTRTGLHMLHEGEEVVPRSRARDGMGGREMTVKIVGGPVIINDQRSMDMFARKLSESLSRVDARST